MSKHSNSAEASPGTPVRSGAEKSGPVGNPGTSLGSTPGYAEQNPPDRSTARQPGGKRPPDSEEGGIRRDVDADAGADPDGERKSD